MVETERGISLKTHAGNRKCEKCNKSFFANDSTQRGSRRKYCSLKCRNAAYHERQIIAIKSAKNQLNNLREENAKLIAKINKLETEPTIDS